MDSFEGEDREELLDIELLIFQNIKEEIESQFGEWSGSKIENSKADAKVAECILNSFRSYERGRKLNGSFFTFKRK